MIYYINLMEFPVPCSIFFILTIPLRLSIKYWEMCFINLMETVLIL